MSAATTIHTHAAVRVAAAALAFGGSAATGAFVMTSDFWSSGSPQLTASQMARDRAQHAVATVQLHKPAHLRGWHKPKVPKKHAVAPRVVWIAAPTTAVAAAPAAASAPTPATAPKHTAPTAAPKPTPAPATHEGDNGSDDHHPEGGDT